MLSENIKKNILDLHHNKNLQYLNTCVIILFTYTIGIAIFTKQLDFSKSIHTTTIFLTSFVLLIITSITMIKLKENINKIEEEIKTLKI